MTEPHTIPGQQYAQPARDYIWAKVPTAGLTWQQQWRWVKCPNWPQKPRLSGIGLAKAIFYLRWYFDTLKDVQTRWDDFARPSNPAVALKSCSRYPKAIGDFAQQKGIVGEINSYFGRSLSIVPFLQRVWREVLPGQVVFHGMVHVKIDYKSNPGGRKDPANVAARLLSRAAVLNEAINRGYWKVIAENKDLIGYARTAANWAGDLSINDSELLQRYRNMYLLIKALVSVPWPHALFRSFLTSPSVSVPPFYGNSRYHEPGISAQSVPQSVEDIGKDIARYIAANESAFNQNFQIKFEEYVKHLEGIAERHEKQAKVLGIAVAVIGAVASLITAGVLAPVLISVAQSAVSLYSTKRLTKDQVGMMEKIFAILAMDEKAMGRFRLWITARIEKEPEAPPAENLSGRYSAFIEEEQVAVSDDEMAALGMAFQKAKSGERITLKDNSTGKVTVYVRDGDKLRIVPQNVAAKTQELPKESIKKMVEPKADMPGWVIPASLAIFLVQ